MASDIVRKVQAACAFGTPNAEVSAEIINEVRSMSKKIEDARIIAIRQDSPLKEQLLAVLDGS